MPETLYQSAESNPMPTGDYQYFYMNVKDNSASTQILECSKASFSNEISQALATIRLTVLYPFPRMQEIVKQEYEEGNSPVHLTTTEEEFLIKLDSTRSKSAASPRISTSQERNAWKMFNRGQKLRIIEFGVSND